MKPQNPASTICLITGFLFILIIESTSIGSRALAQSETTPKDPQDTPESKITVVHDDFEDTYNVMTKDLIGLLKKNESDTIKTFVYLGWNSDLKDRCLFGVAVYGAQDSIKSVRLRVDGEIITLTSADKGASTPEMEKVGVSRQIFYCDMAVLQKMLSAKRLLCRVSTKEKLVDSVILDEGKESDLFKCLKPFVEKVNEAKARSR